MWMLWLEEHLVLKSADEQNTKRLLMTELCLCVLLTNPLFCLSRSTEQISLFYLNYILVVYFDYFIEPVFWQSWFKTICDLMQFFLQLIQYMISERLLWILLLEQSGFSNPHRLAYSVKTSLVCRLLWRIKKHRSCFV